MLNIMIWTKGKIERLKKQATESQGRIKDLFISCAIPVKQDSYAWGQFLDEPRDNTQYGIYGTSAAIQVLSLAGFNSTHKFITGASKILEDTFTKKTGLFHEKGDLYVLYKLTYFAEGEKPTENDITSKNPIMEKIIKCAIEGQGFGEYFISNKKKSIHSKVVATAFALLSLKRYHPFLLSSQCKSILKWLCRIISENGKLRPHELGLATLALIEYKTLSNGISNYKSTLHECKKRLISWANSRKKYRFGESEVYYYSTRLNNRRQNRYLFFLPDCLIAIVFLKLNCPKQTLNYLLGVVRHFTGKILGKNGFTPNITNRASTVDNLWIYRLLKEFKSTKTTFLFPSTIVSWWEKSRLGKFLILFSLLAISILGSSIATVNASSDKIFPHLFFSIIGGIMATISFGLLVQFIFELITKKKTHESN